MILCIGIGTLSLWSQNESRFKGLYTFVSTPEEYEPDPIYIHKTAYSAPKYESPDIEHIKDSLQLLRYPARRIDKRSAFIPDSFTIRRSFEANPPQNFTPPDNTLAFDPINETLVTAINATFAVYNSNGFRSRLVGFRQLAAQPNLNSILFDPRVIFDHARRRWLMLILHGTSSQNSRLLLFASNSDNPADGWHLHQLDGNPFKNNCFADFPHLAVSATMLYITVNHFSDHGGYNQTLVYTAPLSQVYQAGALDYQVKNNFSGFNNRQPFTLVPAFQEDEENRDEGLWFLSSPSAGGNYLDLFYYHPGVRQDHYLVRTIDYTLPTSPQMPNTNNQLNTSDCRVQSAFLSQNLIHFTLNSSGEQFKDRKSVV